MLENFPVSNLALNKRVPQLRRIHMAARQIGQQTSKCDSHQKKRLKFLDNSEVQQHAGNGNHYNGFPAAVCKKRRKPGIHRQRLEGFKYIHAPFPPLRQNE